MGQRSVFPTACGDGQLTDPAADQFRQSGGSPSGEPLASGRTTDSAEMVLRLTEDHERIAQGLTDLVVRRLFAAGLDLQAALGLLGEHRATAKVYHAIDELDQAIVDLRDSIFGPAPAG